MYEELICACFFMIFSCLAGESLHFYDEVHELNKIPAEDTVRRIYMARHIIEKYIVPGIIFHGVKKFLVKFSLMYS